MRWHGQSYCSTKLIRTFFRPSLRLLWGNVQESVLREAKARLPENLKLRLDKRPLCLVQKRTLFSVERSQGHRGHPIRLPRSSERQHLDARTRFGNSWRLISFCRVIVPGRSSHPDRRRHPAPRMTPYHTPPPTGGDTRPETGPILATGARSIPRQRPRRPRRRRCKTCCAYPFSFSLANSSRHEPVCLVDLSPIDISPERPRW